MAFACCLFAAVPALAAPPSPPPSRYTLKRATVEPAPQQSGRYTLRARATPAPSAGELREGPNYALIGRFAKAGVDCNRIFLNGFENP